MCYRTQGRVCRPPIRQRPPLQLHSSRGSRSSGNSNQKMFVFLVFLYFTTPLKLRIKSSGNSGRRFSKTNPTLKINVQSFQTAKLAVPMPMRQTTEIRTVYLWKCDCFCDTWLNCPQMYDACKKLPQQ